MRLLRMRNKSLLLDGHSSNRFIGISLTTLAIRDSYFLASLLVVLLSQEIFYSKSEYIRACTRDRKRGNRYGIEQADRHPD